MRDLTQRINYHQCRELTITKELYENDGVKTENVVLVFKGTERTVEIELHGADDQRLKITRRKNVNYREVNK